MSAWDLETYSRAPARVYRAPLPTRAREEGPALRRVARNPTRETRYPHSRRRRRRRNEEVIAIDQDPLGVQGAPIVRAPRAKKKTRKRDAERDAETLSRARASLADERTGRK